MEANALAGADTITLGAGWYGLTIEQGTGPDDPSDGDLDIDGDLTIVGQNYGSTYIANWGANDRIIELHAGSLDLQNVTLDGGNADEGGCLFANTGTTSILRGSQLRGCYAGTAGGGVFNEGDLAIVSSVIFESGTEQKGGGVYNNGSLLLSNSAIAYGWAGSGHGGGIYNDGGTTTVRVSVVRDNNANQHGGGLYTDGGTVEVLHSVFKYNDAEVGGGIRNVEGAVTIEYSEFIQNHARSYGGAVHQGETGTLTVLGSTFYRNNADTAGGAIEVFGGTAEVINSSLSQNGAGGGGGGLLVSNSGSINVYNATIIENWGGNEGGGLWVDTGSAITLVNTINYGNNTGGTDPDCYILGTVTTDHNNVLADGGSCPVGASDVPTTMGIWDFVNTRLMQEGGPTRTHRLWYRPDNPALNAGDPTVCADTNTVNNIDQRGLPRDSYGDCDIGARETVYMYPIENSSFELNGDGTELTPDLWTLKTLALGDGVVLRPGDEGDYDFVFLGTGITKSVQQKVGEGGAAGDQVRLSAWARAVNLPAGTKAQVIVTLLNSATGDKEKITLDFPTGTYGWQQMSAVHTAGIDFDSFKAQVKFNATGGRFYVDDIYLILLGWTPSPAPDPLLEQRMQ